MLAVQVDDFDALHLCGIVAVRTGRAREGTELLAKAALLNRNNADVHNNHGNALGALGRHAEALASYERAVALTRRRRGRTSIAAMHCALGRHTEALASDERASALEPAMPTRT